MHHMNAYAENNKVGSIGLFIYIAFRFNFWTPLAQQKGIWTLTIFIKPSRGGSYEKFKFRYLTTFSRQTNASFMFESLIQEYLFCRNSARCCLSVSTKKLTQHIFHAIFLHGGQHFVLFFFL